MSIKDGPGEGTWSVFAQKVVEQRDEAREEIANLRKTIDGVSRSLAAVSNGWAYEHEPVLHVSQALKLACDTIDDLRAERRRLTRLLEDAREEIDAVLARLRDARAENERLRHVLADIREWSKDDHVMRFDDGDIALADYCTDALNGGK